MVAIEPSYIIGHITSNHPALKAVADPTQLSVVLRQLPVHPALPAMSNLIIHPEIQGLKLHHGLKCNECHVIRLNSKSMKQHFAQEHPGQTVPPRFSACHAQRLTAGAGFTSSYFQVNKQTALSATPWEAMVATAQAEMADEETMDHCQNRQINARLVSPWLITTKWHEHVAGYHIGTLIQLVATPKKDEFPGLKKLVFNYMSSATGFIKSTAELVLQTLNTPDPAKT